MNVASVELCDPTVNRHTHVIEETGTQVIGLLAAVTGIATLLALPALQVYFRIRRSSHAIFVAEKYWNLASVSSFIALLVWLLSGPRSAMATSACPCFLLRH
jgi:hypothetical protein